MIAYVGFTGARGHFGRTHASVATAAVAFAEARGDLVATVNRLLGIQRGAPLPPMKLVELHTGVPVLPVDGGLMIAGDFESYTLRFFAPINWASGEPVWWPVGALKPRFTLGDVETVETNMALATPAPRSRALRLVAP